MKSLFLVVALMMQVSSEPYPGQGEHAKPPDGWMCEPQNYELSVPVAHVCNCERMYDDNTKSVIEDRECTVFCHADHCACPMSNDPADR